MKKTENDQSSNIVASLSTVAMMHHNHRRASLFPDFNAASVHFTSTPSAQHKPIAGSESEVSFFLEEHSERDDSPVNQKTSNNRHKHSSDRN